MSDNLDHDGHNCHGLNQAPMPGTEDSINDNHECKPTLSGSTTPNDAIELTNLTVSKEKSNPPVQRVNTDSLPLTIAFKDVSAYVMVPKSHSTHKTFISPLINLANVIATCGKSAEKTKFYRVQNASGIVRPRTMTMVISPPGHGKSSYLKIISQRLRHNEGTLLYNGNNIAKDQICDPMKLTSYLDQVDQHFALLTVNETLNFTHKTTSGNYDPKNIDEIIEAFGLKLCQDTIIGDQMVRGVSGGERRRVSVAEPFLSDARCICLDEYSNGLDSAVTESMARTFRSWCHERNLSVIAAVQQPTPVLYDIFDRVVVLREGSIVYDGPREDLSAFFEGMGFKCPSDVDLCDFVIDVLSQPKLALFRLRQEERHGKSGAVSSSDAFSSNPSSKVIQTSLGDLHPSHVPCISTQDMVDYYHTTPFWKHIAADLDAVIDQYNTKGDRDNPNGEIKSQSEFIVNTPRGVSDVGTATAGEESNVVNQNTATTVVSNDQTNGRQHGSGTSSTEQESIELLKQPLITKESQRLFSNSYRIPTWDLVSEILDRQIKLTLRNKSIMISRIINTIVMSLIFGGLYFNIAEEDFFLRVASFLVGLSQVAFNNMVDLPINIQASQMIRKQLQSSAYPTFAYIVANAVCSLPYALFEGMIFSIVLYFMYGAYHGALEFFVYYCVVMGVSLSTSSWYRMWSIVGTSAPAICGPSTSYSLVFAGFYIFPSNFKIWIMRIPYWLSPFSWGIRSMAINEFNSSRYDQLVLLDPAEGPVRRGTLYLQYIDMYTDSAWILYGLIYLLGLTIFLMLVHAYFLHNKYIEISIGTRRSSEEEEITQDLEEEIAANAAVSEPAASPPAIANDGEVEAQIEQSVTQSMTASHFNTQSLRTLTDQIKFTPVWLSFNHIKYTVKVVDEHGNTVDRVLLDDVHGYAEPGKLMALMGPSGAGKTTLLDVISNRKNTGTVDGKILMNSQVPTPQHYARLTAYVEQFDSLFPFDTVENTLLFAARLRLPASVPESIKRKVVNEVLNILDLSHIRHFLIGNPLVPGLSPAQKKLVSIGVELVANPSVLYLDEPTTGLDSKAAQTVMRAVRRIARAGRSVICTIHQPSAELYYLFDRLVLLGPGGHQMYFGDLGHRSKTLVKYFKSIPYIDPLPDNYNPSSWSLEQISKPFPEGVALPDPLPDGFESLEPKRKTIHALAAAYKASKLYKFANKQLEVLESLQTAPLEVVEGGDDTAVVDGNADEHAGDDDNQLQDHHEGTTNPPRARKHSISMSMSTTRQTVVAPKFNTHSLIAEPPSIWLQFTALFIRNFQGYWNNPPLMFSRMMVITTTSLIYGLIYFDIDVKDTSTVISYVSCCVILTGNISLPIAATALPHLMSTRLVFYRERASLYYHGGLWTIANLFCEVICALPCVIIGFIPMYFMVGMPLDAGIIFRYLLTIYLSALTFTSMIMLIAAVSPNQPVGQVLSSMFYSLCFAFNGVAIPFPRLSNGFFQAIYHLFPLGKTNFALTSISFEPDAGKTIEVVVNDIPTLVDLQEYVADYFGVGIGGGHYWEEFGWFILSIFVLQTFSFVFTLFMSFNKR